jgi:hypothetical protein
MLMLHDDMESQNELFADALNGCQYFTFQSLTITKTRPSGSAQRSVAKETDSEPIAEYLNSVRV